jgi:hypothetical protein
MTGGRLLRLPRGGGGGGGNIVSSTARQEGIISSVASLIQIEYVRRWLKALFLPHSKIKDS